MKQYTPYVPKSFLKKEKKKKFSFKHKLSAFYIKHKVKKGKRETTHFL